MRRSLEDYATGPRRLKTNHQVQDDPSPPGVDCLRKQRTKRGETRDSPDVPAPPPIFNRGNSCSDVGRSRRGRRRYYAYQVARFVEIQGDSIAHVIPVVVVVVPQITHASWRGQKR